MGAPENPEPTFDPARRAFLLGREQPRQLAPDAVQVARVSQACLENRAIACRLCADHCDAGALRFRPRAGGRTQVEIDARSCTGCGACVAPCPVAALSLHVLAGDGHGV